MESVRWEETFAAPEAATFDPVTLLTQDGPRFTTQFYLLPSGFLSARPGGGGHFDSAYFCQGGGSVCPTVGAE